MTLIDSAQKVGPPAFSAASYQVLQQRIHQLSVQQGQFQPAFGRAIQGHTAVPAADTFERQVAPKSRLSLPPTIMALTNSLSLEPSTSTRTKLSVEEQTGEELIDIAGFMLDSAAGSVGLLSPKRLGPFLKSVQNNMPTPGDDHQPKLEIMAELAERATTREDLEKFCDCLGLPATYEFQKALKKWLNARYMDYAVREINQLDKLKFTKKDVQALAYEEINDLDALVKLPPDVKQLLKKPFVTNSSEDYLPAWKKLTKLVKQHLAPPKEQIISRLINSHRYKIAGRVEYSLLKDLKGPKGYQQTKQDAKHWEVLITQYLLHPTAEIPENGQGD